MKKVHGIAKRIIIDLLGFGLIILSPFVGILPGPGGIIIFFAGLGILSNNYAWAQKILHEIRDKGEDIAEKYIYSSRTVSWLLDILAICLLTVGILLLLHLPDGILRDSCVGLITLSLVIFFVNKKRFGRAKKHLSKLFKRKH